MGLSIHSMSYTAKGETPESSLVLAPSGLAHVYNRADHQAPTTHTHG